MTTPLTRSALEQASFWGEAVCLSCSTIQTERAAGENCQECEAPDTVPASLALQFLDRMEAGDE